jgi:antitoxin (DNA-binding transcriptional repressor) of toxin-antitoxin stability system
LGARITIIVKIGEAKTHLSKLLGKVEAGEEVIISRGEEPIAKLTRFRQDKKDIDALIAEIKAGRDRFKRAPVTTEESSPGRTKDTAQIAARDSRPAIGGSRAAGKRRIRLTLSPVTSASARSNAMSMRCRAGNYRYASSTSWTIRSDGCLPSAVIVM